jgi:hypothetical protein
MLAPALTDAPLEPVGTLRAAVHLPALGALPGGGFGFSRLRNAFHRA